jgi:hypothetical protein
MGSGGGGTSTQYVKSETSNLPGYVRPYFENLLQQAEGLTLGGTYTPYGDQRLADFTPQQQQIQKEIGGLQTPGQFLTASQMATQAGLASANAGKYDPAQFNMQTVTPEMLQYFQMGGPESFTEAGMADQYMSPYVQNVLDIQKREAQRDAQKTQLANDLGAARQGVYGGSRQLLAAMERERNLGQNMSDIQAKGLQSAYEAAQGQFNTESAARQAAQRTNLEAALGVQQLGSQQGMQAALANQQYDLEAQRLGEQSRQFGTQQRLAGLGQALQSAQTLGNLGQYQQQGDLARLTAQQQAAAQQQALNQQYLDQQYEDFLRQRDYPLEMLQQYSSILRGVPVAANTTTTVNAPKPSLAQQLMGGGLGALGMYKSLSGG